MRTHQGARPEEGGPVWNRVYDASELLPGGIPAGRDRLVRPKESEQEFIHGKYIGELLNNRFLPETRAEILKHCAKDEDEDGIEALVLAGTELPLLLRGSGIAHAEFIDTTLIHVEAIVDELLR